MTLVMTPQVDAIGKAGVKPAYSRGTRPLAFSVYDADMDTTNYAADGEPVGASFIADWKEILYVGIEQKDTQTAADRREFAYDYAGNKVLFYDAFNTEETASNQTVVALRLFVVGIPA